MIDMEVDVIHSYSSQLDVVDESSIGNDKFGPHVALVDYASSSMTNLDPGTSKVDLIDLTFLVTRDDSYHIHNLEPIISLSLVHPDLIDWSIQDQPPIFPHSKMTMRSLAI